MLLTLSPAPLPTESVPLPGGDHLRYRLDPGDRECVDPESGVRVLLRGEVYRPSARDQGRTLLDHYLDKGLEAAGALEGSFLAAVVDPSQGVFVITDPLATRKGYHSVRSGSATVSTSFADHADPWPGVSLAGVCSHLASNGTHGGLTPLEGVEMVPPGSIARVASTGLELRRYHDWRFEPADPRDRDVLRDEMIDLMRASVVDRLEGTEAHSALLSLSGGHDSRGLLGFLVEHLGESNVEAFTYHHGEAIGDMDHDAAIQLAGIAGVRHRVIDGYQGDFMAVLEHNARNGLAIAHFCDEADVWRELEAGSGSPSGQVLVAGDRQPHHVWLGRPLSSAESLSVVSVRPSSGIEWFLGLLPEDASRGLRVGWDERFVEIATWLEGARSWQAALMEAYLIERVAYTLNLWRELFGGGSRIVINPLLDVRLLEFVARLPLDMNDEGKGMLHKEAIAAAFPGYGAIPAASGGWNRPHWGIEMARHASGIREMLEEPSPLDDIIPPEAARRLLTRVEAEGPHLTEATAGLGWQLRKLVKRSPALRERVRRRRIHQMAGVPVVPPHELLRRLLYLRRALTILQTG